MATGKWKIFRLYSINPPLILAFLLLLTLLSCRDRSPNQITVAAASDVSPAFEELGRTFEQAHGTKVVFSFGSSGMITRQIENGAPVDLFASANTEYIDELERKGLIVAGTK